MPFEEAEIQLASVHYAFVCKKPNVEKLLQDDEGGDLGQGEEPGEGEEQEGDVKEEKQEE